MGRKRRETNLDDPVCPGCGSREDLCDVEGDEDIGLLECTFCNIRFWMEEIDEAEEEEVNDDGLAGDPWGACSMGRPRDSREPGDPTEPVLGEIIEVTEKRHA